MSYQFLVVNDNARHYLPLGTTSTNVDVISSATVTATGTVSQGVGLAKSDGLSAVFSAGNFLQFQTTIFTGSVRKDFTVEAWFKGVSVNAVTTIIGHRDVGDGITFDGEKISFTTAHGSAGNATVSYYPENTDQAFHVVGIHTTAKNELYVNGVFVGGVNVTEQQILFGYSSTTEPDYLFLGYGPALTGSVVMDSVAVYPVALDSRQIKLHFLEARDVQDTETIVTARKGLLWSLTDHSANVAERTVYSTEQDWRDGLSASVDVDGDSIIPRVDANGASIAGSWQNGFIFSGRDTTYQGSKIEWDSDGPVVVEVSLNSGTTWTAAINGRSIPGIATNFTTTNKSLDIRVRFVGGTTGDISRVRKIKVTFYRTLQIVSKQSGRVAYATGAATFSSEKYEPIEHFDRAGAYLPDALVIPNPNAEPIRVVEVWFRPIVYDASIRYIIDGRTAALPPGNFYVRYSSAGISSTNATVYVNGRPHNTSTNPIRPYQWNHIVANTSATWSGDITIGAAYTTTSSRSQAQYSSVAIYSAAMTAAQVLALYNSYLSPPPTTVTEGSTLTLTDSTPGLLKVYSFDWSIVSTGS